MNIPTHWPLRNIDDLFRLAHIHIFGKDISASSRAADVAGYHVTGHPPNYVKKYLERFEL